MVGLTGKILTKMLLICLDCNEKFSIQDAWEGKYWVETGICHICYRKRQRNIDTCFGVKSKGRRLGYDEETIDCQEFCKDRKICKEFVEKSKKRNAI